MRGAMVVALAVAALPIRIGHAEPAKPPSGLAIGVEAGEPSSITAAFFAGRIAVAGAAGTGTFYGPGLSLHADVLATATRLAPAIPVLVGAGVRWYDQHYAASSADERPSKNVGVRASVEVAYERAPLTLYVELAPGVDVSRSPSCTLADGVDSICPHAMSTPLFVDVTVGARWFLGRRGK